MSRERNPQIFVAKLPSGIREKDLEYEFRRYGTIKNIQLKRGYAFIEYEDYKDAEDAIKEMDGKRLEGQRIVVQQASNTIINFKWEEKEIGIETLIGIEILTGIETGREIEKTEV